MPFKARPQCTYDIFNATKNTHHPFQCIQLRYVVVDVEEHTSPTMIVTFNGRVLKHYWITPTRSAWVQACAWLPHQVASLASERASSSTGMRACARWGRHFVPKEDVGQRYDPTRNAEASELLHVIILEKGSPNDLLNFFRISEPVPSKRPRACGSRLGTVASPTTEEVFHEVEIKDGTFWAHFHNFPGGRNLSDMKNSDLTGYYRIPCLAFSEGQEGYNPNVQTSPSCYHIPALPLQHRIII